MKKLVLLLSAVSLVSMAPVAAQDSTDESDSESPDELQSRVEAMDETMLDMKSTLDAMKKIKISSYLHFQYQTADTAGNALFPIGRFSSGAFANGVDNRFWIRRGRLKATYTEDFAGLVLQIDMSERGLLVLDAYGTVTDPWLRSFTLTTGIFNRPFGFEIGYSSSLRESPERSRVMQTLFPGERDLGAQLGVAFEEAEGVLGYFNLKAGIFNGTRGDVAENDNNKDFIGRLGVELPFPDEGLAVDGGVSLYTGHVTSHSPVVYDMGTLDGRPAFVRDSSAANLDAAFRRTYVGGDLQIYYDLPVIGGFSIRGEYIAGLQPSTAKSPYYYTTTTADSLYNRDVAGYYVMFVQNIGLANQFVLKYDVFDPNTAVEGDDIGVPGTELTYGDVKYSTLGVGWVHHWDSHLKLTAYYEFVENETVNALATGSLVPYKRDVPDDILTLRAQYRF